MCDDFIKTINDVDFIYGFIYECAKLINNLYGYNYNYLAIKLCEKCVIPIIIITKKEHIEEYNRHIRDIINNLEDNTDIVSFIRLTNYLRCFMTNLLHFQIQSLAA